MAADEVYTASGDLFSDQSVRSQHGVKRSRAANRDSEAEAEARRLKEQARIKEYLGLTDELAKIVRIPTTTQLL